MFFYSEHGSYKQDSDVIKRKKQCVTYTELPLIGL